MNRWPSRILVPVDFSSGTDEALDYAVALARALEAEVVVLHAWEVPRMGSAEGPLLVASDLPARLAESAREGVERIVRERAPSGVPIRGIARQGDPWRAIVDAVLAEGIDLVVMRTHGRRGLPRALLGSVAEKVIRAAPCAVLTLRAS